MVNKSNRNNMPAGGNKTRNKRRSTRRSGAPSAVPLLGAIVRPPAAFLRGNDVVPMHLKGTRSLLNVYDGVGSSGSGNLSIALTPMNISSAGYSSLKHVFPVLNSMEGSFTKFTITRLKVEVRSVSASTGGGYVAFCYEASGPTHTSPPHSVADASSGAHSAIVTPGNVAGFTLNCSDYENDWSELGADSTLKADCGSLQFITENPLSANSVSAIIMLEIDFFFTGYRVTG